MDRYHVFVYGTLKKGQPNEYAMTLHGRVEFICRAMTSERYPLVIGQPWNLPQLLDVPGKGRNVNGEVYAVDGAALAQLDYFEGHPLLYERREIHVRPAHPAGDCRADDIKTMQCWTYFYKDTQPSYLDLPHYDDYDSKGSHGLEYDIRENEGQSGSRDGWLQPGF